MSKKCFKGIKFLFRSLLTFIKEMIEVNRNLVEVYCLSGQSQQELESQVMDKNQNTLPIEVLLLEEDSASALVLLNLDEFHMYHVCKLIKISGRTFSMYTNMVTMVLCQI